MNVDLRRLAVTALLVLAVGAPIVAQREAWTRPFPAHRVIGNLYAVGTYDLAVFLLTSDEGHILINTGLDDSTVLIRENIQSLGFRLEDVKILLQMQAHWDHTAALAEIKQITGAEMWATAADAPVLEDGGFSDPHFGGRESFTPVEVDKIIADGEVIELGEIRLTVLETPGHTAGSISLLVADAKVLIVGDALQFRRRRLELPAPAVSQDMQQARESLKRLLPLDFETICFSHFEPLRNDGRQAVQALIDDVT